MRSRPSQLKISCKNKTTPFSSSRFFLFIMCLPRNSIPYYTSIILVCWKNLDQFLLRQSLVNHPTMTVKIWKFLASILYSKSPANIPGTLKVKMMNVLYFFVINRLYLNCNAKLTAEPQVINYRHKICNNVIPTQTFCLKIFFYRKAKNY